MHEVQEFERKLIRTGSIMEFKDGEVDLPQEKCWLVWYRPKGVERYKGLLNTISTSKEAAQQKKERIKSKGAFDGCQCGIAIFLADTKKIQVLPPDKDEINIPSKVLSKVRKDIMKNASFISQVDIKNFVVVDTETTGLSNKDEVVELAAVKFTNGKMDGKFHSYIIPTVKMHFAAQRTHGLTLQFLMKNGRESGEVFDEFKEWLGDYPVCAHNFKFDKRMIENHSKKIGIIINLKKGFCTLELSKKVMAIVSHKLENIKNVFDLGKGLKSHNAMDDVVVTAKYASLLSKIYQYTCVQALERV